MKQAIKEINEIKRMREALTHAKSNYLKRDYGKAIARKTKELKDYCKFRDLDFKELSI